MPHHCFYLIFILGKKWPLRRYRNKEVTVCFLLLVLKGLSLLATGSQHSDIGFQIQEKNSPLESLLICFFGTTNTIIK